MIDPSQIIRYDHTDQELEELILFCIAVAGKNAKTTANNMERFKKTFPEYWNKSQSLFQNIKAFVDTLGINRFANVLRNLGFGCYNNKAKSFYAIATSGLNLRICTVANLEKIYGIGPKTARAFVCWSRPNQQYAILDTHILKWLAEQGIKVPKNTPTGKRYIELEQEFLKHVPPGYTPAEFDLIIWNKYRRK